MWGTPSAQCLYGETSQKRGTTEGRYFRPQAMPNDWAIPSYRVSDFDE
jgi:hypothetical protein